MPGTNCPAVLARIIVLVSLVLSSLEAAEALQAEVDYSSKSCSSSCTLSEVARLIRAEFSDVKDLIVANQLSSVEASKRALVSALVRK